MPVRRTRRRYLAIEIEGERPRDAKELEQLILDAVVSLFGEVGASEASFKVIEYDASKGVGIIRCPHLKMGLVRAAMASVTNLRGSPTAIHVVDVSGTLRALRKRLPSRLMHLAEPKGLSDTKPRGSRG